MKVKDAIDHLRWFDPESEIALDIPRLTKMQEFLLQVDGSDIEFYRITLPALAELKKYVVEDYSNIEKWLNEAITQGKVRKVYVANADYRLDIDKHRYALESVECWDVTYDVPPSGDPIIID